MALYQRLSSRPFEQPVLVLGMEGWIDAGMGGAAAMAALLTSRPTEVVARFDTDELLDHRARRPVLHIVDGLNSGLTWPDIELRAGSDDNGRDVLFLVGPEPDMRWRAFVADVIELAQSAGVRMVIGLGAFPAPVPHTRPVRLATTATVIELAERMGYINGTLDVPAGIHSALEEAFASVAVPAVGLWARVPHYVSAMPYPAATAALIDGLADVAGLTLDSHDLHDSAARTHVRIDELIANSDEHRQMVAQLEAQADQEQAAAAGLTGAIPSGDEIAAELERFLRGEGPR
jgi:predicted ATP-grasp superfamily ATP-dependent carboligase